MNPRAPIIIVHDGTVLEELVAFAALPENVFQLTPKAEEIHRNNPAFSRLVKCTIMSHVIGSFDQTLRVTFSIAEESGHRFRLGLFSLADGSDGLGLAVTVKRNGATGQIRSKGMPAPSAVQAMCLMLGFTGDLGDWQIKMLREVDQEDLHPVVLIVQELPETRCDA